MARRLGPRFGLEAAFLVAVAIVAGILELSWPAIIAVMFIAWLVVAAVEVAIARRRTAPAPQPEPVLVWEPLDEPEAADLVAPPELAPPAEPEPQQESEAEAAVEEEPEPEPGEEAAAAEEEQEARPELVAVPTPPAEEPEAKAEPEPEPEPVVVELRPAAPREWNLWELERRAREISGGDPQVDEERSYLLMYLREFATAEGTLPRDFDGLVRESFADLIGSPR